MIITGIDTETTGLEQSEGHRIIEIAMLTAKWEDDKMTLLRRYIQRIDPERPIDPKAQEVHGISWTELVGQPKWSDVAETVARQMDGSHLLVAHNMEFDGPFISAELLRAGIVPPPVATFCTMENARWATPTGKKPRLSELCFSLGVTYDTEKAHAAEYDVLVMLKCLARGIKRGFYSLPKGVTHD